MENYQRIQDIFRQIAEKDEELGVLFDNIIRGLSETELSDRNSDSKQPVRSKSEQKKIEDIIYQSNRSKSINVIPGIPGFACHPHCVCFAFDKWNLSKGFHGITKRTISYWHSCSGINRGTLIFSNAWDEVDFNEKYKTQFDQYTKDPQHTVVVILISSRGISLQYINN
jgi:hypothetical protein